MANGFLVMDEKDWEEATSEQRDWIIYKTLKSMDARLRKCQRRDKVTSFFGGIVGGILAWLGVKIGGV
jgi:hypothetical protein